MTEVDLGHGRRLSGEVYDQKVIDLHSNAPAMPSKQEDTALRREELNLAIDYRLGVNFPPEKREALWQIQQRIEKKRLWMIFKTGFGRLFTSRRDTGELERQSDLLTASMIKQYGKVLSDQELRSFFELDADEPL